MVTNDIISATENIIKCYKIKASYECLIDLQPKDMSMSENKNVILLKNIIERTLFQF